MIRRMVTRFFERSAQIFEIRGHHFYGGNLGVNSVVLDLGANKGDFSKRINEMFRCKVYAVEPTPDLFRDFPETDFIKKFNYAMSGENGLVTLHVSSHSEANTIEPKIQELWHHQKSVTVQGITLEQFLKDIGITSVDLMKVDIEGAEVSMMASTSDITLRSIQQISIELHAFAEPNNEPFVKSFESLVQRLKRVGFVCIYRSRDDMDVFFVNKKMKYKKTDHKVLVKAFALLKKINRALPPR